VANLETPTKFLNKRVAMQHDTSTYLQQISKQTWATTAYFCCKEISNISFQELTVAGMATAPLIPLVQVGIVVEAVPSQLHFGALPT